MGVSNVGGIKVKCWWTTSRSLYNLTASGTKFVSNLKRSAEKNVVTWYDYPPDFEPSSIKSF